MIAMYCIKLNSNSLLAKYRDLNQISRIEYNIIDNE